ncbi:MAG: energy transducer TonB [Alphaproteobacteria bacterium]|nr:energy transducer TonB [Alphaproteobacteria bacterium]
MVSLAASWPVAGAARTQAPRLPLTPAGLSILLHGAVAVALTTVALGEGGGMTAPSAPGLAIGIVMAEPAAGAPDRAPGAPGDASADAADPPSEPESQALAVAMAEAPAVAPAADMPDPPPVAPMASALETAPVDPPVPPPPPVQAAEPRPVEPPAPAQAAPPRPAAAPRRAAPARSAAVAGRSVAAPSAPGPGEGGGTAGRQTAALPAGSDAGGIPLILDPNFRARTPPPYPRRAVELGQQGEVVVEALVDAAGVPLSAHVHRSSGFPLLDEAALAAVRAWRFVPAHHAGQAVASRVRLPVRFRLNG